MTKKASLLSQAGHISAFQLITPDELEDLPDLVWLVPGILPNPSFGVLYGEPGCGKTFVALSLALAVASGEPWLGREVEQADVLYVAAEGVLGLKSRVAAHSETVGKVSDRLRFLADAPNILEPKDLAGIHAAIMESGLQPGLMVIDTLARVTVGADENNAKDMGRIVEALDSLRTAFDAAVLVLHHTTKGGGSERGSSALRGAADVMIQCVAADVDEGIGVGLDCTKMKDDEPFDPITAKLEKVALPGGRSSLVLGQQTKRIDFVGSNAAPAILDILQTKFADTGATNTQLREAFEAAGHGSTSTFNRRLKALKGAEKIKTTGSGKGARYFPVGVSVNSVS